ncbi:hypothetical protein Aph01nite_55010 [Acrocarpospora phusangensis]|uniref:Secreted protein n=1 Tax=Acrocarpospora phusangensis TaxID=1070424 RepID=A0A919QE50_9ACTN|nr:hypothetical protein [Acrocarpospora phusangensis]GIH27191.1 hypothetical protein Aph01nite_55010 [Acrocarpospora phusangensis]
MNTAVKLGIYFAGLVVVFGGALGVGALAGPQETTQTAHASEGATAAHGTDDHSATAQEQSGQESGHGSDGHGTDGRAGEQVGVPGGLQVSEGGVALVPESPTLTPGEETRFRFTVTGADGRPVTAYKTEHEKKLHFIVVSRDLGHFQHLHPELGGDGVWSVPLELPSAGTYRAFADFTPDPGDNLTLGVDLFAAGDYTPEPAPAVNRVATVDGYTVTLAGDLVPGTASTLTVQVAKDGKPVTDLQPYLGAYGHLVALRSGDLAYLHVHPETSTTAGPAITFRTEVPSLGDYRLFLDFQHGGKVRTADFTVQAHQH